MASTSNNQQLPPCKYGTPITEECSGAGSDEPSIVTWSQKHTDFALVLKSGKELKCHKHVLAESSSFFDTMLSQQQFTETATSRMKVEHFEEDTVYSFLEYLYTNKTTNEKIIWLYVNSIVPLGNGTDLYTYKRSFPNQAKFTLDLMKMAHMYEVKDLLEDCAEHLLSTMCDHNVMERFHLAEKNQVERLREGAMKFLAERSSKIPIHRIPGFKSAFDNNHRHLGDLLELMSSQKNQLRAQLEAQDKKVTKLERKLAEEKDKIAIKVDRVSWTRSGNSRLDWSVLITCYVTNTVQFVIDTLEDDRIVGLALVDDNPGKDDWLENNSTLEECGIYHSRTLYAFY